MDIDAALAATAAFLWEDRTARKDRDITPLEKRMARAASAMFAKQQRRVLDLLRRHRGDFTEAMSGGDIDALLAEVFSRPDEETVVVFDKTFEEAVKAGALSALSDMGMSLSFNLKDTRAISFLQGRGAARVTRINETTRATIRNILVQAADEGWSYQKTAKEISDRFAAFRVRSPLGHIRTRAELVAVTETGDAYEAGRLAVRDHLVAQGVQMEKSWITVGDDKVCPVCAPNGAVGWIDASASFPSGDSPLAHPGCRCDLALRPAGTGG